MEYGISFAHPTSRKLFACLLSSCPRKWRGSDEGLVSQVNFGVGVKLTELITLFLVDTLVEKKSGKQN